MSTHTVRVNNFIQANEKLALDPLSKLFITIHCLHGLNRIGLLYKRTLFYALSTVYGLILLSSLIYFMSTNPYFKTAHYAEIVKVLQYVLCGILGHTSRNKLSQYYGELNKFDTEVECKPKADRTSILIFLSMVTFCVVAVVPFTRPQYLPYIPFHVIQVIENHYCGFLFNLLNQRLRIINDRIEDSLGSNSNFALTKNVDSVVMGSDDGKPELAMDKLMDYYYTIISAFDLLTDSIKWQLLFIMTTSFCYILTISNYTAFEILSGDYDTTSVVVKLVILGAEALPLVAPCLCCDQLRAEVRRLRELLASKLFEGKLDKRNRSVARALLALTKARNLSFSLLRMVDVSISLPFSFLGLVATYLIILLQFRKVIHTDNRSSLAIGNTTSGD